QTRQGPQSVASPGTFSGGSQISGRSLAPFAHLAGAGRVGYPVPHGRRVGEDIGNVGSGEDRAMGADGAGNSETRLLVLGGCVLSVLGVGWFLLSHLVMKTPAVDAVV